MINEKIHFANLGQFFPPSPSSPTSLPCSLLQLIFVFSIIDLTLTFGLSDLDTSAGWLRLLEQLSDCWTQPLNAAGKLSCSLPFSLLVCAIGTIMQQSFRKGCPALEPARGQMPGNFKRNLHLWLYVSVSYGHLHID